MFEPTDEHRRTARAMAGFGIPQDDIAILLDIDPKTLRRHFRRELDRGSIEATAKVAQTLFHMATVDKNVAAAIFWMKARANWREKHEVQVTAKPLQELTNAELGRMIEMMGEALEDDAEAPNEAVPQQPLLDHESGPDSEQW